MLVVAVVALVPVIGFSLFPKAETPQFRIDVRLPVGSSLAATDSAVRFVERLAGTRPEIRSVFSNVGRDNPIVYYNVFPNEEDATVGQVFLTLDRYDPHATRCCSIRFEWNWLGIPVPGSRCASSRTACPSTPIAFDPGPDLDTCRATGRGRGDSP
ncbi:MAG: hypothetical protein R2882_07540 [Gemmatimonadales bacterium]